MHPSTQVLVGMAAAGLVAGPQRPLVLVAGAVAGVLPDVIDWWQRQAWRQPDITVTPDPLAPKPAVMAEGVRLTLQQVRNSGRPCVVRFNPLPAPDGRCVAYDLDCDRLHRLVVLLEGSGKPAPVDLPGASGDSAGILAPFHPLPLRITDTPKDLRLAATGTRIESRDLDEVAGVGHSLFVAGVAAGVAAACNFRIGMAAGAALLAHLLFEIGGRREVAPWSPLSGKTWRGRRLWNERGWRANACAGALAGGTVFAMLLAGWM